MTTNLLRNLSFHARRLRLSPFNPSPNPLFSLSHHTSLFFSCRSDPPHTQKNQHPLDVEDISNEELKKRVARLQEGDEEAIPAVFEAILQRSLAGKPIEADQELMREILGKETVSQDDEDGYDDEEEVEFDSDLEGMNDTDYEDKKELDLKPRSGAHEVKTKRRDE